jgi:hypothetical protein
MVIFGTPRRAELIKALLKPKSYQIVSSQDLLVKHLLNIPPLQELFQGLILTLFPSGGAAWPHPREPGHREQRGGR